jgi:hypothetical protein
VDVDEIGDYGDEFNDYMNEDDMLFSKW